MADQLKNQKEFAISSWAVNNRKTVYLLTFIIVLLGFGSYQSMPKENFPELQIPEIYIGIAYPGNSPEIIADKIAEPIEKELNSIKGIDEVISTSIDGYASIQAKFDFSVSTSKAMQECKDAVDNARAKKEFPELPVEPNIFEMDVSDMPIMNINLSGDYSVSQLNDYGEVLKDLIENLDEISEVDIRGTQELEMKIEVDHKKASAVDVSFGDIQNAVQQENVTMSGGEYLDGKTKRTLKIDGEFTSAEEIGDIIVKQEDYKPVYLKDVATIAFADADTTSFARERRQKVVMLDVKKRSGQNLLDASDKIHALLDNVHKDKIIPQGVNISVTNDQSGQTREMVDNLVNSVIFGVLLVVGVLLFFLGLRNSLFVGIAIPTSMFMSFLILSSMGVTLNVMVLFSMVLALGMLVDNGIVVVENVQRLMEEGYEPFTAVKKGVGEIAWPIIASTATTLGAFIPLAFWPGIMGEFMQYLPITLIIVLGSSLFVALVINPVFTAMYMKLKENNPEFSLPSFVISSLAILVALPALAGIPMVGETVIFLALFIGLFILLLRELKGGILKRIFLSLLLAIVLGPILTGVLFMGGVGVGAAILFFAGMLTLFGKYIFVAKETPIKKLILPFAVLVTLGLLYAVAGAIAYSNFLLVAGVGVLLYRLALPVIDAFQNRFLPWLETKYRSLLRWAVARNPITVFVGTWLFLFVAIGMVGAFTPNVLFFPEGQPKYVNIFIQHPIGTDINVTNKTTRETERMLHEEILVDEVADTVGKPYEEWIIQSIIAQVGEGTSDPMQGPVMGNTPHKARITVNFSEFKYRGDYQTSEILKKISRGLRNKFPADVQVNVEQNKDGPPTAPPINIEVSGEVEYDQLIEQAEAIRLHLDRKNVKGVTKLKLDVETGKPELPIVIDREKARLFNTSTYTVANTIRTALFGSDISTFKQDDEIYDIVVRFDQNDRNDIDELLNQKITFMNNRGKMLRIPVHSLIEEPEPTTTFGSVVHKDLVPVVTVYSSVSDGENPNEVVEEMKKLLAEYESETEVPAGIEFNFTGEQEEQAKEMAFLSKALVIALFIILLVIVMQFNAFSSPVIIMFAVFFSLIGVLMGEVIFQMDFVIIMTMIGIISLAGVVVNNAIVLIDYTNLLRKRKREELGLDQYTFLELPDLIEIIVQAGKTRLRPVLLTAITTVLGLIPLAVGINIDFTSLMSEYNANFYIGGDNTMFFGPMSWTIIFGLSFATFLTLVFVPVMYLLLWRFKLWLFKLTGSKMRSSI